MKYGKSIIYIEDRYAQLFDKEMIKTYVVPRSQTIQHDILSATHKLQSFGNSDDGIQLMLRMTGDKSNLSWLFISSKLKLAIISSFCLLISVQMLLMQGDSIQLKPAF